MDKFEQVQALHKLLRSRRTPISRADLESRLGLSHSTTTRLLSFCKDRLHMPIEHSREKGGYFYGDAQRDSFELPGLWFNSSELIALLTSHRLLADVQPGILNPWIGPLQQRIEQLLEHKHAGSKEVFNRIRVLPMANRIARRSPRDMAALTTHQHLHYNTDFYRQPEDLPHECPSHLLSRNRALRLRAPRHG